MPSERPDRLSSDAIAAFKRAHQIPAGVKWVFVEDWILDRSPRGSFIGAKKLADRLGMSRENVEQHRRKLLDLGFYFVIRSGVVGLPDGWVPMLPLGCRHRGTTDEQKAETAARIDAYVEGSLAHIATGVADSARTGIARPARTGVAGSARAGVAHSAQTGVVGSATRGDQEGAFLAPDVVKQPLDAVEVSREATRDRASALEAEQEEPRPREIDKRPADEVTDEGFERLRQRRADPKRQAGGGLA